MASNFVIYCVFVASDAVDRVVDADSRNQLVLHGPLYISTQRKTLVVLKMLVLECVWEPCLVHPRMIKSCLPLLSSCDKMYQALSLLTRERLKMRLILTYVYAQVTCLQMP